MTHWLRKHLCDLAWLSRECGMDESIPAEKRASFLDVNRQAKALLSCLQYHNTAVSNTIAAMCNTCRETRLCDCTGRSSWRQPCELMQDRLS